MAKAYGGPEANKENPHKILEYLLRAIALFDPQKYRTYGVDLNSGIGLTYYRLKDFAKAKYHLNAALVFARDFDWSGYVSVIQYRLAQIAMDDNDVNDALRHVDEALPDSKMRTNAHRCIARPRTGARGSWPEKGKPRYARDCADKTPTIEIADRNPLPRCR
jgi:tetratricopeptide (TPR) repeat protein